MKKERNPNGKRSEEFVNVRMSPEQFIAYRDKKPTEKDPYVRAAQEEIGADYTPEERELREDLKYINRFIKELGEEEVDEDNPHVKEFLKSYKWDEREGELREAYATIEAAKKSAEKNLEEANNAIGKHYGNRSKMLSFGEEDETKKNIRNRTIGMANVLTRKPEYVGRKILRFPLEFIANYSGMELDFTPLVEENPDQYLVDGIFETIKERATPKEMNVEGEQTRLDIEKDITLDNLRTKYAQIYQGYDSELQRMAKGIADHRIKRDEERKALILNFESYRNDLARRIAELGKTREKAA